MRAHPTSGLTMSTVPMIIVFTKFDLFVARQCGGKDDISVEFAERKFKEEHSQAFEKWTKNISGQIPYNVAASRFVS